MGGPSDFEIAAPEFEIAPPTPKLRPEDQAQIDQAIRSVPLSKPDYMQTEQTLLHPISEPPTPVSAEAEQYQKDLRGQRQRPSAADLAATAAEMFTTPTGGAVSTEAGEGAGVRRHLKQVATPGQRVTGSLGLASDIAQAPAPAMGPAALEAGGSLLSALKLGAGVGAGMGASYGVGKVAPKVGANEEQTQLAQDLAFWMPSVAASLSGLSVSGADLPEVKGGTVGIKGAKAGVAVTPESVNIGGRVGPFRGSVSIPRNGSAAAAAPVLEPPTIEGSQVDPSSQMLADHEVIQQRAARVANGQPPVEPPPAPPAPPKVTEITQDDIQHVAGLISKLPAELRAQGLLEAHQTMARILEANGKVVGPDGKLVIIDSPKAAEKAAANMVNDEVDRQDKAQQESEKAKPAPEVKAEAPANRKGRRAQQAAIEAKAYEVSAPEPKFEVAAPEKAEVESANAETDNAQRVDDNLSKTTISAGHNQPSGDNTVDVQAATGTGNNTGASEKNVPSESVKGGADVSATGTVGNEKTGFQKGQQVRFSKDFPVRKGQNQEVSETIPQGTSAFIEHAGAHDSGSGFLRLRLADGRKISVNQRMVEAHTEPAPELTKRAVDAGIFKSGPGPEPGEVGTMKVSDLKMAPNKFQYKLGTDAEGVSSLLKEQDKYKPDLAGVVSVWRDPADGQMYVVNGHHRFELAKRTRQKEIAVRHIQAPDAKRARSIGALQNIAEGRGTPVDAAKFFRDSSVTPEDLKKEGISLGEQTAKNGMALSRLDTPLFNKVVSGDLRLGRAVAIGEATDDPAEQKAILSLVDKKEARGQKISDGVLSELIRFVKESGREKETTSDLFGSQEITKSLALEKAEISDYIRQQLSKDRKLFGFVSKEGRAEDLARAGNKIDVDKSKEISVGAQQAEEVYNRLSARGGDIADILDQSAKRLAGKENAATVKSDAYNRIRESVRKALSGGEAAGTEGREKVSRSGGEPSEVAKPSGQPKDTVSLFHSPESPEEPAPVFYSKAQRVALEKVPNSAPGGSILATLKNNGVKDDEIKWLGLDDFLYGKFHVTKKELMKHIAENTLQVGEVSHGTNPNLDRIKELQSERAKVKAHNDMLYMMQLRFAPDEAVRDLFETLKGEDKAATDTALESIPENFRRGAREFVESDRKLRELDQEAERLGSNSKMWQSQPKYSQYTLPGDKKNYTELLLTLPLMPSPEMKAAAQKLKSAESAELAAQRQGHDILNRGDLTDATDQANSEFQRAREASSAKTFRSGHFDEPNILAHVRFDERTDADGKKTLLVEEVQSDWHQKGKKEGYGKQLSHQVYVDGDPYAYFDSKTKPLLAGREVTIAEYVAHLKKEEPQSEVTVSTQEGRGGVPDAPFKTDWHELAMKRMLRYAAEHNYDKLAWVTGKQTADRYDLAKHLETIYYEKNESDGTYDVTAQTTNGRNVDVATHVTPDKLVDHIGKDITQRIVEGKGDNAGPGVRALRGVDLKVGGEWAKRLYDQAIPNFVNKVAKKWGAKVGENQIQTGDNTDRVYKGPNATEDHLFELAKRENRRERYYGDTPSPVGDQAQQVALAMQRGRSFIEAMDSHGGKELAEELGGRFEFGKSHMAPVHSVDITPQMQHSVVYEGQPLFANDGYSLIRDRAPEAWAKVADLSFATPVKPKGLKPYAKVSSHGMQLISRALRRNILGASIPEKNAPELYDELERIADQIRPANEDSARNVERFIKDLKSVEQPKSGLTIAPDRGRMNADQDLRVLHEELFHSEAQVEPGKGVLAKGVPAEMINDPGVVKMKTRIGNETGAHYIPEIIIAEAMADIVTGTPHELSPEEAEATATKYYQALAEMHGAGPLEAAQRIHELIDQKAAESGIIPAGGKFNDPENRPAREALSKVLGEIRSNGEVREREAEAGSGAKTLQPSGNETGKIEAANRVSPSGGQNADLPAREGEGNRGNGERSVSVASTGGVGLSDEELEEWSKAKGFRVEPAGEQLGMFGDSEPVQRVFRMVRGKEQSGLIYQSQLEKLNRQAEAPTEPFALTGGDARESDQPRLFGAGDLGEIIGGKTSLFHELHKNQSGEMNIGPVVKAAETVHSFLKQEVEDTRRAKDLQWEMYDLDKRHEGRVLRAKQLLEHLQAQGVTQEDRRAIDQHLDALEADSDSVTVPSLTEKQDDILDKVLLPLKEEAEAAFKKVTEGGMTIPNYNPRQTKGKGGMLDRFLTKQGQRWSGRANLLSKQMPATKHRVMMALEDENGERKIVSIKGGQVTAWKDGQPENIGGLSTTDEGRAFEDKDGNIWKLKQATKDEIEQESNVRYYHDAAASTIVNWLQAKKAEAAHDFLENFKHSDDFENIAMKTGQGNPPKGWRTTNLPQFKGYYFEPHTAEVFDWFFDRLKSGDPDAFGAINSFMRARILLNPIKHPVNIAAHAFIQRGVSGFLPNRMYRLAKTGARALNAVWNQNQDYLDALDAGAPLQSAHDATRDLVKLFYEQMADAADKGEPWATKAAKAIGFPPTTLVHMLHKLSSKIAWPASDMMFLQAAYEYQDTHAGVSLKDSFREVGRIIPEYRLPVRIMNSTTIGKIMGSKWGTIFGSYHYGELRAFSESMKSAFGAGEAKSGQSKAEDVAKGWDRLAMMALGMVLLGGAIRKLLQEVTGDKDAEPAYPGVFGLLHAVERVGRREETPTQAGLKVVTPNPATMGITQLAFNRDFSTGRHIYDPAAKWDVEAEQLMHYLKENTAPMGSEIERAGHTNQGWKKLAWNQLDVNFPKHGAAALAQQIASSKLDTSAMTDADREKYYARQKAIQGIRNGDDSALDEARAKGLLTPAEARQLHKRARKTEIEDKVHDFTEAELREVYDRAVSDGEQETAEKLARMMRLKRRERLLRHLERFGDNEVPTEHAEASVAE